RNATVSNVVDQLLIAVEILIGAYPFNVGTPAAVRPKHSERIRAGPTCWDYKRDMLFAGATGAHTKCDSPKYILRIWAGLNFGTVIAREDHIIGTGRKREVG